MSIRGGLIEIRCTVTERLYSITEIGRTLGVDRHSMHQYAERPGAPAADFEIYRGKVAQELWTEASFDHWRAFFASQLSVPRHSKARPEARRRPGTQPYSDHQAFNQVGPMVVTWKLWWRCTFDGGTMWWFSTPKGWWVSNDDGQTWDDADVMERPGDYHYFCVNGNVRPKPHVTNVLRSAEKLRQRLEDR